MKQFFSSLIIAALLASCKKFVEIPLPVNEVQAESVFNNEQTATAAMAGLYSQMLATTFGIANGGLTLYPGLSADEIYNTSPSSDLDPFYNNSIPPTNSTGLSSRLWSAAYKNIYHANSVIEKLTASSLGPAFKNPLIAEAKLIRALLYHYMVNLFGDVPLITSTGYAANALMPRTALNEVYQQIIADLRQAHDDLPLAYVSSNRARPNKYTAAALLARVYLYRQDWNNAMAYATELIDAGIYSLNSNLNNVFLSASNETIWQLPKDIANTIEGSNFIPSSATVKPTYAVSSFLLSAFETGDQRKINWLRSNTVSGLPYYYPYKYKSRVASPITEGYIVLRLAEMFLIRAEAKTNLNDLTGAKTDLNTIRNRAGLSSSTAATQSQLLSAIEQERRVELFIEWGHRWFDLKRTGRADIVLPSLKPGWKPTAVLYPVPQNEILRNVFLTQNPGY